MNLSPIQTTAVIRSFEKALKSQAADARQDAEEDLRELYELTGADHLQVNIGGVDVGTFAINFDNTKYEVTDKEAFDDFLLANGLGDEKKTINPSWMFKAIQLMEEHYPQGIDRTVEIHKDTPKLFKRIDNETLVIEGTDEIVPGIKPKSKTIKNMVLRGCEPDDVIPAIKGLGVGMEQLLLGGNDE